MRRRAFLMSVGVLLVASVALCQEQFWFTPKFSDEEGCDRFMASPHVVVSANGEVVFSGPALSPFIKSGYCTWLVNNLPNENITVTVEIGEPDSFGHTEPGIRPGDFYWEGYLEAGYGVSLHELQMVETLHLIEPRDNEEPFPSYPYPQLPTEATFTWEPATDVDYYKVWAGCMTKSSNGWFNDDHYEDTSVTISGFPAGRDSGCSFRAEAIVAGEDGSEIATARIYSVYGDWVVNRFQFGVSPLGTTVITHGWQLSGEVPPWVFAMGSKIKERAGGGRIRLYNKATGSLDSCAGQNEYCDEDSEGELVVIFDWATESKSDEGYSEAAAEALVASLLQAKNDGETLLDPIHLIGHSRGTVVNSEAAERLVALGYRVHHVTNLDPHDWGGADFSDDFDVNELHPEYPANVKEGHEDRIASVVSWDGVVYSDTYWEDQAWVDGRRVPGTANLELDFNYSGLDPLKAHGLVHSFYYFTVPVDTPGTGNEPNIDGDGTEYDPNWYGAEDHCRMFPNPVERRLINNETMERLYEGFGMSLIADASWCGPEYGTPFPKTPVLFDYSLPEGIVNGDFEKGSRAGWVNHGGRAEEVCFHKSVDGGCFSSHSPSQWLGRVFQNDYMQHNRFFLPESATAIRFCRAVADPGIYSTNYFTVSLRHPAGNAKRFLHSENIGASGQTGWDCYRVSLNPDEAGKIWLLRFNLFADGWFPARGEVWIDYVSLEVPFFRDGFENGDTSAWSEVQPQ